MAALRGTLEGNRGTVSRLGSKNSGIHSVLSTWNGEVITYLSADGTFRIDIRKFSGPTERIAEGNVDNGTVDKEYLSIPAEGRQIYH